MTLRDVLTDDLIRDWAGPRYYERGEGYFFEDRVVHLSQRNQKITGTVAGTYDYRVELWADGDEFCYACDCPLGLDDESASTVSRRRCNGWIRIVTRLTVRAAGRKPVPRPAAN